MSTFSVLQESEGEWTSDKTVEVLRLRIPTYFVPDPQLLHDFITGFQTGRCVRCKLSQIRRVVSTDNVCLYPS